MKLPIILMLLSVFAASPVRADQAPTFGNEREALTYCQGGGVVWLDLTSGRYVYKGSRFYGKGKNAVYVCEVDALRAGGHASYAK